LKPNLPMQALAVCWLGFAAPILPAAEHDAARQNENMAATPDEKPLWRLLQKEQYDALQAEIERMRATDANWKPPRELPGLLQEGKLRLRVERAIRDRDMAALAQIGKYHPESFSCKHIDRAWALAEAHAALKQQNALLRSLRRLIADCNEQDRLATLYKAREWLDSDSWESLLEREAQAKHTQEGNAKFQRLRYDYGVEKLLAANRSKDTGAFHAQFNKIADDVERHRDTGVALLGAWHYFNTRETATAAAWFARALTWDPMRQDARRGLALCALADKRYEDAQRFASELPAGSEGRQNILRDALTGMAQAEYDGKNYARTAQLLDEAGRKAELPRYAKLMSAWSRFQLGEMDMAADQFLDIYRQAPDEESAQGVFYSLLKAGRQDELDSLDEGELPESRPSYYYGEQLFDKKHFLAARAKRPDAYADLGAVAGTQGALYFASRDKTGTDGLSRLKITHAPLAEAGWAVGQSGEMRLRLDRIRLDSGSPLSGALLGSNSTGAWAFQPTTRVDGVEPHLTWRDEGKQIWEAEIGLTPGGGEIAARPVGRLFHQHDADDGSYSFDLYREPVRESILSYTGLRDPYGGTVWGGVKRTGISAGLSRKLNQDWNARGTISGEQINGSGVADNSHVAFEAGINKNMTWSGFSYAALGLSAGFGHYSSNLSHFTLGHGGYFSPQTFWHYGPSLDFMTEENRQFIVKGRLAAGGVNKREDAAPRFPLAPDGNDYDGNNDNGRSYELELNGVWRLGDHVQAGGMFAKRYAPQYSDVVAMVFIRVLLEPRKSVLSADLAKSLMK